MSLNRLLKLMTSCIDGKPRNYKKSSSNASNWTVPGSGNIINKINKGSCHFKNNNHNKQFMGTVGSGDVVKRYFLSKALVALALGRAKPFVQF